MYHSGRLAVSRTSPHASMKASLALLVVGSMLALGAVHLPVLLVVAGLAALASLSVRPRGAIPAPAWIFLALALFTFLQALPLPEGALALLSPNAAEVWSRSLLPVGESPALSSLSLDPGATLVEALKWLTYATVFLLAASLSRARGAVFGASLIVASAALAALVTLAHGLLSATAVYGLYEPSFPTAPLLLGPLLNPNNLAGYLNLGTFAALGLLLRRQDDVGLPRVVLALSVALTLGGAALTASRAGVIALLLGLFAFAVFAIRSRRSRGRALALLGFALSLGGGIALALLGATHETSRELFSKDLAKLEMVAWLRPLLRDYGWLGVGRGAFESVFPAYRPAGGNVVFTHIESFPAQWIAEWGLPVGFAALLAFGAVFFPRRGVKRSGPLAFGLGLGLAALFLQNLADLALEVPAVAIAAVTLLGTLWGRAHVAHEDPASAPSRHRRAASLGMKFALGVLPGALIVILLASGFRDLASDRARVRALVEAAPPPEAREAVVEAMRRHPAEPYFPLMGAVVARQDRRDPMPWISASLERALVNPRAHLLLADALHARGAVSQALLELRIALAQEPTLAGPIAAVALRMTRDFDALVSVAEEGRGGGWVLDDMAARIDDDPALRLALYREAALRDETRPGPRFALGEDRLRALRGEAGCEPSAEACLLEIESHAQAVDRALPTSSRAAQLRAGALAAQGRYAEADRLLAERCPLASDELPCLRSRASLVAGADDASLFPRAVKALLSRACATTLDCAEAAALAGRLHASRGDRGAALSLYLRAAREDSTEPRWRAVHEAAVASGSHAQAVEALERIARLRGGEDDELRRELDQARLRALSR